MISPVRIFSRIKPRLLSSALADCHTCVEVNIIIDRQVIIALGSLGHVFLGNHGIPETVFVLAVVVDLLDGFLSWIDPVYPFWDL